MSTPRKRANGAVRPARRYASTRAAAEAYGVDEKTIRRWIADGLIHGYRVGAKLIRVDLNEIDDRVVREIPAAEVKA